MNRLAIHAQTLPEGWKWDALFTPPEGFETEWRSWLAQAQGAEESTLLGWWGHRATRTPDEAARDEGDEGLLAA